MEAHSGVCGDGGHRRANPRCAPMGSGLGVKARRAWRGSGALLVLGALLIATDVAGQNPRLLENNGGHFRFGNIRWYVPHSPVCVCASMRAFEAGD